LFRSNKPKTYKLPRLSQTQMMALIETISPMLIARTETASHSRAGFIRAERLNDLVNTLEPALYSYYDDVENIPHLPII
jgi:hypothetical protein